MHPDVKQTGFRMHSSVREIARRQVSGTGYSTPELPAAAGDAHGSLGVEQLRKQAGSRGPSGRAPPELANVRRGAADPPRPGKLSVFMHAGARPAHALLSPHWRSSRRVQDDDRGSSAWQYGCVAILASSLVQGPVEGDQNGAAPFRKGEQVAGPYPLGSRPGGERRRGFPE